MKPVVKQLYFLLMLVVAFFATTYMLSNIFWHPSSIILGIGGDTMKNYFSFLQHATQGQGMHFTGMNYPYGENIVYADGQPMLALLLQYFQPLTYSDALMVLHLAVVLGFFLAIVYSYKTLVYFKVHPLVATIGAVLLSIMSPQIFRLFGHFGLSYLCAIPMLFYWSVKYHHTGKFYNIIFIFIAGCIFSFAHPYFAALFFMWTIFYSIGHTLINRETIRQRIKHILPIFIAGVSIVVFVKIIMHFTDEVSDRTTFPLGILSACTTYLEVFTSTVSPIWTYLFDNGYILHIGDQVEGVAYTGIVVLVVLVVAVLTIIVRAIKKKNAFTLSQHAGFDPLWLLIALFAIILAHGAPFIWMEWLLDYVSIFRQFRSLGRFAWIFYYITTIYVIVILYRLYVQQLKNKRVKTAAAILILPLLIWAWEAHSFVKYAIGQTQAGSLNYDKILNTAKKEKGWDGFLAEHRYNEDTFQAIIELPYVHVGSEKIWLNGDNMWVMTLAAQASLQLNLPIVNVNMSRSSWSQTFDQVKLIGGPYVEKPLLKSIRSNKPFLLIHWYDRALDDDSKYLFDAADSIGVYDQCIVYAMYPERLTQIDDTYQSYAYATVKDKIVTDTCINCGNAPYIIDHFDEDNMGADYLFRNGARKANKQKAGLIREYTIPTIDTICSYEISLWVFVNTYDYKSPNLVVEILDADSNIIASTRLEGKNSTDSYGKLWLRTNNYLDIPANAKTIRLLIDKHQVSNYLALDELVIKPAHATVISKSVHNKDVRLMVNNHLLGDK